MMRAADRVRAVILLILLAGSAVVLLFPTFSDQLSTLAALEIIGRYEETLAETAEEQLSREAAAAKAYNREIYAHQKAKAFSYEGDRAFLEDARYLQLLDGADGTMGALEIGNLSLFLPIFHGTSDQHLRTGCGHLHGTSLPVGGPDTHAVLASHSGLQGAELFSRLTKLRRGDLFRIHILGEIHRYEICEIRTVLPEEEDPFLQIEEGEDLVTLYTCTPLGINDHRLLVRGRRIRDFSESSARTQTTTVKSRRRALRTMLLLLLVPSGISAFGFTRIHTHSRRHNPSF